MTELTVLGILALVILGMLGAFHFGSRKDQVGMPSMPKDYDISEGEMDIPEEVTEEDYLKSLKSWKINGGETENPESNTG